MDAAGQTLLRSYLLPGERLLWTGRPRQGILFAGSDAFLIPFSLFWGGFAIAWNVGVWMIPPTGPDIAFKLFGLPFLIVGLYLIFGRFLHDSSIRRQTFYAVTDRRVIALRASRRRKFKSLDIRLLPALELEEHPDGTGTLTFDTAASIFDWARYGGVNWWLTSSSSGLRFFRIERPREVYALVHDQSGHASSV